jgi:hypothetical protein
VFYNWSRIYKNKMRLLRVLRRHASARTLVALLIVAVWGGTVDWGHTGWDDPACDPMPVQHDHAAHRVSNDTRTPIAPAGHCEFCHFLRLLHTALSAKSLAASLVAHSDPHRPPDRVFAAALFAFYVPSRAPPARLA